jgi:hypothetical protein
MSDDLVKQARYAALSDMEHWRSVSLIEELDGIIRHDRERIVELVSMVNSKDARIEELEAKLEAVAMVRDLMGQKWGEAEAKLEKAVEALEDDMIYGVITHTSRTTLAELKGEDRG